MPSRPYRENEDGHAIALIASSATAVMTRKQSGKAYEFVGSRLGSPSETPNTAVDWAEGGG
jgi:hypothetical protein